MNKSTSQKTGGCKAAKLPTAQTSIVLTIPAAVAPLLSACAAAVEISPHEYILESLFAAIKGEADSFGRTVNETLKRLEGGQQ